MYSRSNSFFAFLINRQSDSTITAPTIILNKHLLRRLLVAKNRRFVPGARDWAVERIVKENMVAIVCVASLYVFMLFVASTLTAVEMHRAHACSKVSAREVLIEKGRWTRITGYTWGMAECDAMVEQLGQKHGINVHLGSVTDQGIDHCAHISRVCISCDCSITRFQSFFLSLRSSESSDDDESSESESDDDESSDSMSSG